MARRRPDKHTKDLFNDMLLADSGDVIAGVDEAGRGPLAGPVVAAAVILDPDRPIEGLRDSKKLTPERRDRLAEEIKLKARAWCVAEADVREIEELNILQATMLAMHRAISGLSIEPRLVLVDGNRVPEWSACPINAIVKGDDKIAAISAASILAKTTRDHWLETLDAKYPGYGFAKHKGYCVPEHVEAIRRLGILPIHRRTFEPIASMLGTDEPDLDSGR
ncbi:MAG: ribonuclease HII [Duodenibacillus sp.]|nr:ribonuclease HII [Duodenibacillus sp.]